MKLEHTALVVNNLEREKDFFLHYFGGTASPKYENLKTGSASYFISFGGASRLELVYRPKRWKPYLPEYTHLAFSVGSKKAVNELTLLLESDGYEIASGPHFSEIGCYESCVLDREGNLVEIIV